MECNTQALRELLRTAFNDEELSILAYDNFREVSNNFTSGQTKTAMAQMLIEHCERKGCLDKLLRSVEKANPSKYAEFAPRLFADVLDKRLSETLRVYLARAFNDDKYARLDQAGETDPDRSTLLHQVFVDLEAEPRDEQQILRLRKRQKALFGEVERVEEEPPTSSKEKVLSAMSCFLQELWPRIVVIGGPGHGKSTLGQYLAQVHRAILLDRQQELSTPAAGDGVTEQIFKPKILRTPFRIILKDFAQWLTDRPPIESVEAYLAARIEKATSRKVSPEEVQEIVRARPALVIFDGLDEVIEPDLRSRVLERIDAFRELAEELGVDLQVLATSRPTGYSDQFGPEQFWYLELQPMSAEKVRDYATRWVRIKAPVKEEQRRILDTLAECRQEEHTRLLLTTPLQVTIILLIIKDGGRPPAQREALFHEYWGTILRREKAKAKGVIRTEEALLFDLHAYLGYLLHRRAAGEDVRSLLPETEFAQAVRTFLREKDSRSPEDAIEQLAAQMINEAGERLVLLVSPEPGLFGFELRSLQEFFAAAYLAQTARDTAQRFERLKAIARSEHWRNVALFFAGRVVRIFGGEAANILVACQAVDRDPPDRYLRRGAWLALEIVADGAFAANRDLQYSALEYALTVLETGAAEGNRQRLNTALGRIAPDDLGPLLEQKLDSLPPAYLYTGLDIYGQFIGTQQPFVRGLEHLLSTNRSENVLSALNLGFNYRVEPQWFATQLERYWSTWAEGDLQSTLWEWWLRAPAHVQAALSAWSPSEDRIRHLLNSLLSRLMYLIPADLPIKIIDEPRSLTDQMIVILQCDFLISSLDYLIMSPESIKVKNCGEVRLIDLDEAPERRTAYAAYRTVSISQLDRLLAYPDLMPQLRAYLWFLYCTVHEPVEAKVLAFIKEVRTWVKADIVPGDTLSFWMGNTWPLLRFVVEREINGDQQAIKRLQPYLNEAQEIAINKQVRGAVRTLAQRASCKEWAEFRLTCDIGEMINLPELAPISEQLGITVNELLQMHLSYFLRENQTYSSTEVLRIFSAMEKAFDRFQKMDRNIIGAKWSLDRTTLNQGKQLLVTLIDRIYHKPDLITGAVKLFLKLLTADQIILSLASALLTAISDIREVKISPWDLSELLVAIPQRRLAELAKFVDQEDKVVQQGAFVLWEILIRSSWWPSNVLMMGFDPRQLEKLKSLRFDWQIGLSLVGHTDSTRRRQGIALLSLSNFPIGDAARRTELLNAMAKAQEEDEVSIWTQLLRRIAISAPREMAWRKALESILAQPRIYSPAILTAAMERYRALVGAAGPHIAGDEQALGLPSVAAQRS